MPGVILAEDDSSVAPNTPEYPGSHRFYEDYVRIMAGHREISSVDFLVIFRVLDGSQHPVQFAQTIRVSGAQKVFAISPLSSVGSDYHQ